MKQASKTAAPVIKSQLANDPEMAELGDMPELFVKIIEGSFYGTGSTQAVLQSHFKKLMPRISEGADLPPWQWMEGGTSTHPTSSSAAC